MQLIKSTDLLPHDSILTVEGVSHFVVMLTLEPGGCTILWQSMATGERWQDCYSKHERLEVFRV
jgi:hypothetical protein